MTTVDIASASPGGTRTTHRGVPLSRIPLSRITTTELRKMFDTRSGFWLLASIGILSVLATATVILFGRVEELTYNTFAAAIDIPMTVILPIIAILSVTGEWSQRSGLTTFTLVPHRGRVIAAKAISCVVVAVVTIPLAFGIGALGNVVGTAIAGVDPVWDGHEPAHDRPDQRARSDGRLHARCGDPDLGRGDRGLLRLLVLLPTLALLLATSQEWFRDLQPWVDFHYAQGALLEGPLTAQQWSHLGVTGLIWLVIPLTVGLWFVLRAEVK